MKLHHVSFAVKSTEESVKAFKSIYPKVELLKFFEKTQNVYITYLSKNGKIPFVELVEPVGDPNPVKNLLKNQSSVSYHLCYLTNNFDKEIKIFKKKGFMMISSPFKTYSQKNMWASHFFHPSTGVIEIMGTKK